MTTATQKRCDIKDINLAAAGKKRILWADGDMPVLSRIRDRFARDASWHFVERTIEIDLVGDLSEHLRFDLARATGSKS